MADIITTIINNASVHGSKPDINKVIHVTRLSETKDIVKRMMQIAIIIECSSVVYADITEYECLANCVSTKYFNINKLCGRRT
jgi:hypothetical protein